MFRRSLTVVLAAAIALSSLPFVHAQSKSPADTGSKTMKEAKAKVPALKPFDLNTAAEDDLVLAGIDRAVAKKVIAARPYKNKKELLSKKLLTEEQYNKVKDNLVAKQPPKGQSK